MIRDARYESQQYLLFNQEIIEMVHHSRALAASDTSVKDGEIGRVQMIIKNNGEEVLSNKLYHKKWAENLSKSAEALLLLELLQVIVKKSYHIQ